LAGVTVTVLPPFLAQAAVASLTALVSASPDELMSMVSLTPAAAPPPAASPPLPLLSPLSPPLQAAASIRPSPATSARGARVGRIIVDHSSFGGSCFALGDGPRDEWSRRIGGPRSLLRGLDA
jgi:hypothetical protein